ncbi:MAG TPA: RNA-binding domain-containing protein [Thermoplasmata archaeon]|jgi:hypothetical protein|nr:RNA-binding domain-containing protein [Thermoplasmata archaeon]
MTRIRVTAPVRPTEDVAKVTRAVLNLFPDARIEVRGDSIIGETESLDRLRELIRNQKIRDAARSLLRRARVGARTSVGLSKQAAFMGRVNFSATSPLGDLAVEIESDDLDALIDHVAESTVRPKG